MDKVDINKYNFKIDLNKYNLVPTPEELVEKISSVSQQEVAVDNMQQSIDYMRKAAVGSDSNRADECREEYFAMQLVYYMARKNNDFKTFLEQIEWPHSTNGTFENAILNLNTLSEMKIFYDCFFIWYSSGHETIKEAKRKVKINIGFVMNKATWKQRLKWWWLFKIKRTDHHYC